MSRRAHVVTLSPEERAAVKQRIGAGIAPARELTRCRILLKVDTGQPGPRLTDVQVAVAVEVSPRTVARVRADFAAGGIARATERQAPVRMYARRLDGAAEAKLIELACGPAPDGHRIWSLRLLSEALVRLEVVEHVAPNTVRAVLKNELSPWQVRSWCLSNLEEKARSGFVARMEDVLSVYARPVDPARPLICLDETGKELQAETRPPEPARPGQGARRDPEYRRNGSASLLLWTAPHLGKRGIRVTAQRTRVEWAAAMRALVEEVFPEAEKVVVVLDNLNTHTLAALYHTYPPPVARRIADKLELHYTPTHASWLNMAEIELSVLKRQCLNRRRIPDAEQLHTQVAAWAADRNERQRGIDWHFTTADARIKLKRLYPTPVFDK